MHIFWKKVCIQKLNILYSYELKTKTNNSSWYNLCCVSVLPDIILFI